MLLGMRIVVTCLVVLCLENLAPAFAAPAPVVSSVWLGAQFERSAIIERVVPASPAAAAGLRAGDRILKIGDIAIENAPDVTRAISQHKAGDKVDVVIERADARVTASVTIAPRRTPAETQRALLVGKKAPDLDLEMMEGASMKLSALKGKVVVLDFWATWCVPCVKVMPKLNAWHKALGDKGLVIVGITQEDAAEVKAFAAENTAVAYPIALDESQDAIRKYRVQGLPMTTVIDKTGVVRIVELGGDLGSMEAEIRKLMK
jgi:thiol-disulfide isomerase/thioredoxin